jgi:2-isopropylmalate synthase
VSRRPLPLDSVVVFDTTLRDGEQTPGVAFSVADKVRIARKLDEVGVHVIEAGFPVNSPEEFDAVARIAESVEAQVCGLARIVPKDIDAAINAGVDMVHIFASTSDIQIEKSMHATREEVAARTREAVKRIKAAGRECMYSPMDATRTDPEYLVEVCRIAEEAGADWINLPDTVGVGTPERIREMVSRVGRKVRTPLSIHCHNDFGLAVANTLAAYEAGARMVQVSVNGIGERAGNASFEEVVMGLECLQGVRTGIATARIYELSKLVERISSVAVPPNKAVVGANAFAHESGIHAAGVIEDSRTFEPGVMTPEMVGHRRRLVVGKHTGRHSVERELKDAGIEATPAQVDEVARRVKSMGAKGKRVMTADLHAIAEAVIGTGGSGERAIELEQVMVTTGTRVSPTASVVARVHGEVMVEAQTGVGPVDAAMRAIQRMVGGRPRLEIAEFHIDAIAGGSDAVAQVHLTVEDEEGRTASASAANDDIVMASVEALVAAVNQLVRVRKAEAPRVMAI